MPTLGALFDLKKVGTEQNCWQVFWRAVRPRQIAGASLYEGSIHRDDYCIAIQSISPEMVDVVRMALWHCEEFKEVCCPDPFIEGENCVAVSLPRSGRIDYEGNLIGDDKRMAEHVTAPIETPEEGVSLDVVDSASTVRHRPATPRSGDLPIIDGFEDFEALLKDRFVCRQPGFERDLWISPKELCDMVEKYSEVLEVGLSEHNSERAENALRVRLFPRDHSDEPPIELEGLYMFKSRFAVTQFLQSFLSTPKYADAIPDLAGIIGRFQLHFGQPRSGDSRSREADYSGEERISPGELWPRLQKIRESFGDELNRAVDALTRRRQADAAAAANPILEEGVPQEIPEAEVIVLNAEISEERKQQREDERKKQERENEKRRAEIELETATQEIRRTQARCIYCGKSLSFSDKLKKLDRHKDCWEYVAE